MSVLSWITVSKKISIQSIASLVLIQSIGWPALAADGLDHLKDTAVEGIVIGAIEIQPLTPQWEARRQRMHQQIVEEMKKKSYLQISPVYQVISSKLENQEYVSMAHNLKVTGVIAMELLGIPETSETNVLRTTLRGAATGRILAQWKTTIPSNLTEVDEENLAQTISGSIISNFPYIGIVKKVSRQSGFNKFLINIGKDQNLKAGTRLNVFEFTGDSPNFKSPKKNLAEIEVTKLGARSAVAVVTKSYGRVHPSAKIEPLLTPTRSTMIKAHDGTSANNSETTDSFLYRGPGSLWLGAGPLYKLIDTLTSEDSSSVARRFRVPLSPMLRLTAGFRNFSLDGVYTRAQLESTSVTIYSVKGALDLFEIFLTSKLKSFTGLGALLEQYHLSTKTNAPLTVIQYSPFLDQAFHYLLNPSARLLVTGQIHWPVVSQDRINGSSSTSSFAFAINGGMRVQVSANWSFESLLHHKSTQWHYGSRRLAEVAFASSFAVTHLF